MCICVYVYMCICVNVYVYVYVYVCICMCMCKGILCVFCEYVNMCICVYVYVFECICVYVCACIRSTCIRVYVYTCIRIYVYICECVYVYLCMCVCVHVCMCICLCMYVYMYMYVYMCVCVCVCFTEVDAQSGRAGEKTLSRASMSFPTMYLRETIQRTKTFFSFLHDERPVRWLLHRRNLRSMHEGTEMHEYARKHTRTVMVGRTRSQHIAWQDVSLPTEPRRTHTHAQQTRRAAHHQRERRRTHIPKDKGSPSFMNSVWPPQPVEMVGNPDAIASTMGSPQPSPWVGMAKPSTAWNNLGISSVDSLSVISRKRSPNVRAKESESVLAFVEGETRNAPMTIAPKQMLKQCHHRTVAHACTYVSARCLSVRARGCLCALGVAVCRGQWCVCVGRWLCLCLCVCLRICLCV